VFPLVMTECAFRLKTLEKKDTHMYTHPARLHMHTHMHATAVALQESNLKPGALGAEFAWAMGSETGEAKRSPR
jgi:hypothetical protein